MVIDGKVVLITGGTGSFGKAMVHHLLAKGGIKEIRILSRDEAKQEDMRLSLRSPVVKFYIGDVRSRDSIDGAMRGVDFVFHAAALKQVPSCEFFPVEAVKTNILGSENVIESAIVHGVQKVVCLSTDKAVFPINAMGMTKGLMEKVAEAAARKLGDSDTVISCVRYGNVMYSRGSVIPLFVQQIKNNDPMTLTEGSMTRFLLALAEAVELVEFAFLNASQGDIFIKKAPACTVFDLATAVQELFNVELPISIIGTRHGEKLYETLANAAELERAEDMGGYYRVSMDDRSLNYNLYTSEGSSKQMEVDDYHSHNTERLDVEGVKALLMTLPEIKEELAALGK